MQIYSNNLIINIYKKIFLMSKYIIYILTFLLKIKITIKVFSKINNKILMIYNKYYINH